MLFSQDNYHKIKKACESRREFDFIAPIEATAFSPMNAPQQWTPCPPCVPPLNGYAQILLHTGSDEKGLLTRLELVVHLDGGLILYKALSNDQIALKVTWPTS